MALVEPLNTALGAWNQYADARLITTASLAGYKREAGRVARAERQFILAVERTRWPAPAVHAITRLEDAVSTEFIDWHTMQVATTVGQFRAANDAVTARDSAGASELVREKLGLPPGAFTN